MNIGLAFYTVSAVVSKPDYPEAHGKIRAMGYRFVETGFPLPCPLPEYIKLLKVADLKTSDVHIPLETIQKDFAEIVKTMHSLECKYVTIPHPCSTPHSTEDDWKRLAQGADEAGKKLAGEGLVLQYHNHHVEFQRYGGRTVMELLYSMTDPNYLKAQIDTHWVARGGGSPASWIRRMKGRIDQVHFKDMYLNEKLEPIFAVPGEGNLDWPGIVAACGDCGVKYCIVEVDPNPYTPDPMNACERGYRNLKKMKLAE
jgi:sugar phosphate isomerase/epimerase